MSLISSDRQQWLAQDALQNLEAVVSIDSCSDERSSSVPSTQGQVKLTEALRARFEALGAQVEVDRFANIIARYEGHGAGRDASPIALMIHLDTAHGTKAIPSLYTHPNWDGAALKLPENPTLKVSVARYPSLARYLGHTIVHGPGDAPFGLDDKLGLTHLLSLATTYSELLASDEELDLPPVWLIGRPDEEIGRDDALHSLAQTLAEAGVTRGYTVDGIEPFEVNIANFNGAVARCALPQDTLEPLPEGLPLSITISGVNTHGATAYDEGHRGALRWLTELWAQVNERGVRLCAFEPSEERECDGVVHLWAPDLASAAVTRTTVGALIDPHLPSGASYRFEETPLERQEAGLSADPSLERVLSWLNEVLFQSSAPWPLLAEDSQGWEGYSHPADLSLSTGDSRGWRLTWRVRDFERAGIEARVSWLQERAERLSGARFEWAHQYDNMAKRLSDCPELISWAVAGARAVGVEAQVRPIRGGTGVDPFLDAGVMIANLGTGYFSPESEKELTSLELMVQHGAWLFALLQASLLPSEQLPPPPVAQR